MLRFPETYPANPPLIWFRPTIVHPNIYDTGQVCLDIINTGGAWKPSLTITDILLGLQELLDEPNDSDPANGKAARLYRDDRAAYDEQARATAKKMAAWRVDFCSRGHCTGSIQRYSQIKAGHKQINE